MTKNTFITFINNAKSAFGNKSYTKVAIILVLFVLTNVLKISLYNYFLIPQATGDVFAYRFWFTLLCSIVIFSILFSFKSRYVFLLIFAVQCIYCFTNISYYLYYHSYLHFLQWISLFKEAFISATHLANPKSFQLLIMFIDVPFALYLFLRAFKPDIKKYKLSLIKYTLSAISLIILLILEINNYSAGKSIVHYMDDRYTGETEIVERYGTLVNSGVNIIKNYSETKLISKIVYGKKQTFNSQSQEGKEISASKSVNSSTPNYVIIQVESMDANIVKQKYKNSYIMPFLSTLRENSIYYPYTLSYHKGGGTSDSEFSIINSVEPLDSFPAIKLTSYTYPNSFVSRLKKASYSTMAFHGNVGTFYNRNISLFKMGFNKFYDINSMDYEDEGWGAPDDKVFSFALNKVATGNKPFLAYIITMTSHGPFESARNYYNNTSYDDIDDEIVKNYFNSMSYVDASIKSFVTEIRNKYNNTYIIIYGDHTPNINTKEYNQASFLEGDKYFEFVPLFVITPDNKKHIEDKRVASFLDISPTILNSSGLYFDIKSDGENLIREDNTNMNIPLKSESFDRSWLYNKISTYDYQEAEPKWKKYLPSFISSNLIEKHKK